jgi:E3 ubiquitin-protein ligase BRE1
MKYMQLSLGNSHAIFVLIFSSSPLFILQVRVYLDQIGKVTEDGRQYALNLDSTKWKLVDVEKESQSLKACLEAVQKESEQCKHRITDLQVELKNER